MENTLKKINCISTSSYLRMYCGLPYDDSGVVCTKLKHNRGKVQGNKEASWTCAHYYNQKIRKGGKYCHGISIGCMFALEAKFFWFYDSEKNHEEIIFQCQTKAKCECYEDLKEGGTKKEGIHTETENIIETENNEDRKLL